MPTAFLDPILVLLLSPVSLLLLWGAMVLRRRLTHRHDPMPSADQAEACDTSPVPFRAVDAAFAALNVSLMGRDGKPCVYRSAVVARRAARRSGKPYGLVACDGGHVLLNHPVRAPDVVRAYLRAHYALHPGDPGLPVIWVVDRPHAGLSGGAWRRGRVTLAPAEC